MNFLDYFNDFSPELVKNFLFKSDDEIAFAISSGEVLTPSIMSIIEQMRLLEPSLAGKSDSELYSYIKIAYKMFLATGVQLNEEDTYLATMYLALSLATRRTSNAPLSKEKIGQLETGYFSNSRTSGGIDKWLELYFELLGKSYTGLDYVGF